MKSSLDCRRVVGHAPADIGFFVGVGRADALESFRRWPQPPRIFARLPALSLFLCFLF